MGSAAAGRLPTYLPSLADLSGDRLSHPVSGGSSSALKAPWYSRSITPSRLAMAMNHATIAG